MSVTYGRVGKPVRLYDGFLEKRRIVEARLRQAGLTDSELRAWASDAPGGARVVEEGLMEANIAGGNDLREELLQESGSTSDFGAYLADKATKRLMVGYQEAPSSWRQYTRIYSMPDFKPISFVRIGEMAEPLEINEGSPYVDSPLPEIPGPQVTLGTWGRLFSLSRRAIVNDDLNQLRDRPAGMGRAMARKLAATGVQLLETNPLAYDGTVTFSVAHKNLTTGLFSEEVIGQMITKLRRQTDDNGLRLSLRPTASIIPPELELRAAMIQQSTTVPLAGYAPASTRSVPLSHGMGDANVIQTAIRNWIVEDYLTDPDDFYVMADPNQAPGLAKGFLNGKENPDIFLKDPGMRSVLGTSDPYSMQYDEIIWKSRHDWGDAILDWRGLQKAAN